jgi:hypothetical protein
MTAPIDRLLDRLQAMRRVGPSRWIARCPAHDDRHPSLSLREADDGRVLLRCWSGCEAHAVVAALGLDMRDMFPPRDRQPGDGTPRERRPWMASDLLRLAAHEATIAALIVGDIAEGREADRERLVEAAARLIEMSEAAV